MEGHRSMRYCRCGVRLARDNAATLCLPCQRDAYNELLQPPAVPADFWETDQLRDALARRHLGLVIRAYRTHPHHGARPLSQELVAGWGGLTQAQLSRIESGGPIRDLDRLTHWAQVLQIPQALLWFDLPQSRREPVGAPATMPALMGARLQPAVSAPSDDDPDLSAMQAFRLADRQVGGGHLYAGVVRYLERSVAPRLFGSGGSSGVSVFSAAAGLTEMAGWMAHDVGRDELAEQHFGRARAFASASTDHELEAHILASLSHLAYERRDLAGAVGLARTGKQRAAEGPTSTVVLARLLAMEARGLAARGEHQECRRALTGAEQALTTAPNQEPSVWVSAFDLAALASEAADCFRRLGELDEAETHARQAVNLRSGDRTRSRALGQLALAEIHVAQGRYEEACAVGTQVIGATEGLGSVRVIRQLQELHTLLGKVQSQVTRDFAAQLSSALGTRAWWYSWAETVATEREPEP